MRATYWICLGLCAGLAVALGGCENLDQCEDPGDIEACACAGDDQGARVCQPEYTWSKCDCGASVPDSGMTGGIGGTGGVTGGTGGMTGGTGGMTGGTGGMTGGTGGMTGGTGGATGGTGGEMSGGTGGAGPTDGGVDGSEPEGAGYVACTADTVATDCSAGAECRESDPPFLGEPLFVCAPACTTPADCPASPAGGMATVECTDGHCVLACSTDILMPAECPTGLSCAAKGAVETCYAAP